MPAARAPERSRGEVTREGTGGVGMAGEPADSGPAAPTPSTGRSNHAISWPSAADDHEIAWFGTAGSGEAGAGELLVGGDVALAGGGDDVGGQLGRRRDAVPAGRGQPVADVL